MWGTALGGPSEIYYMKKWEIISGFKSQIMKMQYLLGTYKIKGTC